MASHEDSHLDAQLSIAKAFTLPVFRGARNFGWKPSSGQESAAPSSSASVLRGRGRSSSESRGRKLKASSNPVKGRSSKSPRRGTSPSSKRRGFRKWELCPCPAVIGGCLSLRWQSWRDRGADPWVVEVLRLGCVIPFHSIPPRSGSPFALDSYSPQSVKGRALEEEIQALRCKGVVEPASPSLGFYSRMCVVTKASGGWRPIIDLSTLNLSVVKTQFNKHSLNDLYIAQIPHVRSNYHQKQNL